jgi:hypothetical protein
MDAMWNNFYKWPQIVVFELLRFIRWQSGRRLDSVDTEQIN